MAMFMPIITLLPASHLTNAQSENNCEAKLQCKNGMHVGKKRRQRENVFGTLSISRLPHMRHVALSETQPHFYSARSGEYLKLFPP